MPHNAHNLIADNLSPNGDAFYAELLHIHDGLSKADSDALNARLILLMANQIGDFETLKQLLHYAKEV